MPVPCRKNRVGRPRASARIASIRTDTGFMRKSVLHLLLVLCCNAALWPATANAQARPPQSAPAPGPRPLPSQVTNVSVDRNAAMVTTMCALLAAGVECHRKAVARDPPRAQPRSKMQQQQRAAVEDA